MSRHRWLQPEVVVPLSDDDLVGPTEHELAAIDDEWPVIEAELALVSAECAHALRPGPFTARRVRAAADQLTHAALTAWANKPLLNQHKQGA